MKTHIGKRLLSGLLSLAMVLSLVPAMGLVLDVGAVTVNNHPQYDNYISLPITIRDFAADGMLFEWNEMGNKKNETATFNNKTVIHGNNLGFGLLGTNGNTVYDDLSGTNTITGSSRIENGSWGATTVDGKEYPLNSGATQTLYGALVRTDLVEGTLDKNSKPVYTEATVTYLANYLQKTLPETMQNSSKQYKMWYVMGTELSELGGKDLATKLRQRIGVTLGTKDSGNMGTYADAKAKFEAGNLNSFDKVTSYYDAAYFLLHNLFTDSTGYGMTIPQYKTLDLVQKVDDKGNIYYTYNSAYDGSVYDTATGRIYNSQTQEVTTRSGNQYVRGNLQTENRFDPIGNMGYGKTGNRYLSMVSHVDVTNYYNKSNFNLTLEGHAQFIYYEDDNLYFNFTGDDDVYLYINGVRVLDLGGAHAIAKGGIHLNNVAEQCKLKDGQAYSFDFFYMERHGTAANFGIETNIKIVDPSMLTTKTGYQNGISTGYNGFVDPNEPVSYSFELKNQGEADLQDLVFDDKDIGVYFGHDRATLNTDSNWTNIYLYRYNSDGTIKKSYLAGAVNEDLVKAELAAGLPVGEKIGIYGIAYEIPSNKWSNNTFTNTVYTHATSLGDNNSTHNLNGMADWKVQKSNLVTTPFHVYDWVNKDISKDPDVVCNWTHPANPVTITKSELVQPVKDANHTVPDTVTIALCTPSGSETGNNINPRATLNSDGSISYTGVTPGIDTVYYKIKGMNYDKQVYSFDVYTYGTVNNIYVLDYGLSAELNGEEFGLQANDYLTLQQNPNDTTATVTGLQDATNAYGDFTFDSETKSLKYTPKAIINNTDSVKAKVQLLEEGATTLSKFTGVEMYETVTTVPASVVYYEENFPGITYVTGDGNYWTHYETVDEEGKSVAGTEQSADQESNYGSDPNYAEDKEGSFDDGSPVIDQTSFKLDTTDLDTLQASGVDALNKYLGLGGYDSNGTVNELVVNKTADVMYFDFTGTGFEIISRTTDENYAVINVQVLKDTDGNGEYETVVKQKPVITESKGGNLYQVPIISITDLTRDNYRVAVKAAGSTANVTRVLYIDGIRIYGPLSGDEALQYYNPEEYQAEVFEIKQMIEDGQMIYADVTENEDTGKLEMVTGSTLVEDLTEDGTLTIIESVEDYMKVGPNNELYLEGDSSCSMIAFFLTPDENTPAAERTLQIGAHRKADYLYEDTGDVYMTYGSTADDIVDGTHSFDIASGTEMYYTIDVNNLDMDDEGKYLVLIGTNGSEYLGTTLALTNLKVSGYTVSFAEASVMAAYTAGNMREIPLISEPLKVYKARMTAVKPEATEPEVTEPEVTEPEGIEPSATLTINSASLKSPKVVSGKVATLIVKTSAEAASIVVTDMDGNVMEPQRSTVKASGDTVTFNFIWTVTGSRGQNLDFTIRAYDAEGRPSLNEETVTVTIK